MGLASLDLRLQRLPDIINKLRELKSVGTMACPGRALLARTCPQCGPRADAIMGFDYETDSIVPVEATGARLKRIVATGIAVKLSCADPARAFMAVNSPILASVNCEQEADPRRVIEAGLERSAA
jgi:hypothetical protein